MNEVVRRLAIELESNDPVEQSRAAWIAGGHGADATSLLPRLMEMVSQNPVLESTENRCGEFVSVGRILRSIQELKTQQIATDEMMRLVDQCTSTAMTLLESAAGARASLLMYCLALSGTQAVHAASIVSSVATRLDDQRIKHRAYQFACSVCPELASKPPWSDFAPTNAEERLKWGAL